MVRWLYEVAVGAGLILLVLDPLRLFHIDAPGAIAEKKGRDAKSVPGMTFALSLAVILFVATVRGVFNIGRIELQLLTSILMVVLVGRHMFDVTARNRELPAAKYVAELNPQVLAGLPVALVLAFVTSWFGVVAAAAGTGLAGGTLIVISRRARLGKRAAGFARIYPLLAWGEQFIVLAFSAHCLITSVRLLRG